jgi:hypothetical protein
MLINSNFKNRSLTVLVLFMTEGNECVRSTQGEMSVAPAGIGRFKSRNNVRSDKVRPPPAESPATTMRFGSIA